MSSAPDLFGLAGRTALVTGATGHLGRAMARALAEAGATVLVNGRRPGAVDALVAEIGVSGYLARAAPFDVTDAAAARAALDALAGEPLHILVNNAYAGGAGTLRHATAEAYRASFASVVEAAHNLLDAALPALRRAAERDGDASVVNIASMYGLVSPDLRLYPDPAGANPPAYGAAKAALLQWSRYAACELGRDGIRVNSISPGPFPADAVRADAPDFADALAARTPLGRVGLAEEMRGPLLFLASPAASFVTGANLVVDGGWTAW